MTIKWGIGFLNTFIILPPSGSVPQKIKYQKPSKITLWSVCLSRPFISRTRDSIELKFKRLLRSTVSCSCEKIIPLSLRKKDAAVYSARRTYFDTPMGIKIIG